MSMLRISSAALVLISLTACSKGDEAAKPSTSAPAKSGAPTAGKAAPADAKTIAAYRAANPTKGAQAKIHGYVGSVNGKAWPLVDKVGDTLPFVFCDMATPPAGVAKGAHVVATGTVEDDAMLKSCTITPL